MASEQMTTYERQRLENIKRNREMMFSLKIHSHISDLSSSTKRLRPGKRPRGRPRKDGATAEPSETPIVIRRSLRIQELPPEAVSLPETCKDDLLLISSKSRTMKKSLLPKSKHLPLEDLSLEKTYEGKNSYFALVEKLGRITRKSNINDGIDHSDSTRKLEGVKVEKPVDACSLKFVHDDVAHVVSRSYTRKIHLDEQIQQNDHSNSPTKFERVKLEEPIDPCLLKLEHYKIAHVVPGRIFSIRFFPTAEMTMVVVGNKHGKLGFWDVRPQDVEEEEVIHHYKPHSAPISGISVHPFTLSKVYSCCYDGFLRMMSIEREKFELLYSSCSGCFSLAQKPNDVNSLYIGDGAGGLSILDARIKDISSSWSLHEGRINTIDFSPKNTNIMATSSTDGFACIWDLRNMNAQIKDEHPECKAVWTLKHAQAVHSAYFSPSGSCLATTSFDDYIGVLSGVNFENMFMIPHKNRTNRYMCSFRAVWGWDDTHLYVGNKKRRMDVLSVTQKKLVHTIKSSNIKAIPCRYDAHPCNVGMLAGATNCGQVYVWTASS